MKYRNILTNLERCPLRSNSPVKGRQYSAPGDRAVPAAKQKYVPTSGTYPQGFRVGTTHVGVKPSNTHHDDLALFASDIPCSAAAVFTRNKFKAAPVEVCKRVLSASAGKQSILGVVVNSGCANAVTGSGGLHDAERMATEAGALLAQNTSKKMNQAEPSALVMSTGVIGQRLPIEKISAKIPEAVAGLGLGHESWLAGASAICTTDTFPKLVSRSFSLPSYPETTFSIAGTTKGAGMIHPNMATLLGIVCTDAPLSTEALEKSLKDSVNVSFNRISIDGDSSTNDTVALLANGAAVTKKTELIDAVSTNADYRAFREVLLSFMKQLAQLVVRDGEGATKFVTIRVTGSMNIDNKHRIAESIARSPLVKTALYGRDANWGRILCAIGYANLVRVGEQDQLEAADEVGNVSVSFVKRGRDGKTALDELQLVIRNEPQNVDETKASALLAEEDLEILVHIDPAPGLMKEDFHRLENSRLSSSPFGVSNSQTIDDDSDELIYWTCDFSHEYVTINGDYRT